ncbi:MAG TPA: YciI family protein [Thermoleophilaceae bacterium]
MFLIVLTYVKPLEEVDKLLDDHLAYLDRHYAEGRFLLSGARVPRNGGVILSRGDSKEELDVVVATDPLISEGVATYELLQFQPGRRAKELGNLD